MAIRMELVKKVVCILPNRGKNIVRYFRYYLSLLSKQRRFGSIPQRQPANDPVALRLSNGDRLKRDGLFHLPALTSARF